MKKEIHYIIQELFVESCQQERGETLKKIMDEYLGFIKQEYGKAQVGRVF